MESEYIAVTVCVSVLAGVIIIALVVVCAIKASADRKFKKSMDKRQEYEDMMALREALENPSYVHYPEPEPYTPTHPPEADPWRMSHTETLEHQGPSYDVQDHAMAKSRSSTRPSIHQPYTRPSNDTPNMIRRPSHAQEMPRRPSYAQDLPRRQPQVRGMPRRASRVGHTDRDGRKSMFHNRRLPDVHQKPKLPTRRGSLQPIPMPPNGDKKKLWYLYLNEEPDYFSRDALERNKSHARVSALWASEKRDRPHSPASVYGPMRRESFAQPHPHTQSHLRPQSFPHTQSEPYPHHPDPHQHWI